LATLGVPQQLRRFGSGLYAINTVTIISCLIGTLGAALSQWPVVALRGGHAGSPVTKSRAS